MAATEAGRLLTEAHRLAQGRISTETATRLLVIWRLLNPDDIPGTAPTWVEAALLIIEAQHTASANLAAAYYTRFRAAETGLPVADFTPPPVPALDRRRVWVSLTAEGPARLKRALEAGQDPLEAAGKAATASSGAGARIALNGGSDTILTATQSDPRARGVRRVTSPGCCAFCAMLAARSVSGLSAEFSRPHNACGCQPETAFATGADLASEQARAFDALYREANSGTRPTGTANNSFNAFRRALEAQRRGG